VGGGATGVGNATGVGGATQFGTQVGGATGFGPGLLLQAATGKRTTNTRRLTKNNTIHAGLPVNLTLPMIALP